MVESVVIFGFGNCSAAYFISFHWLTLNSTKNRYAHEIIAKKKTIMLWLMIHNSSARMMQHKEEWTANEKVMMTLSSEKFWIFSLKYIELLILFRGEFVFLQHLTGFQYLRTCEEMSVLMRCNEIENVWVFHTFFYDFLFVRQLKYHSNDQNDPSEWTMFFEYQSIITTLAMCYPTALQHFQNIIN